MISGHLGNWEVAAAAVAVRGVPMDVAAHLQKNPLFYRHMVELQDRLGLTVIVKNQAFRLVPAGPRRGPMWSPSIADQNIRKRGVFVDFFGKAAATAKGPALFALRTGCSGLLGRGGPEARVPLSVPGHHRTCPSSGRGASVVVRMRSVT